MATKLPRRVAAIAVLLLLSLVAFGLQIETLTHNGKVAFFLWLAAGSALAIALLPKMPQPKEYHNFADARALCCGIPNTLDVASNIPFLVVGLQAFVTLRSAASFNHAWEHQGWQLFFVGIALVSFGSAYYHWQPNNATLFWDRAPMGIGFMALFALIIEERIGNAGWLFPILIVLGIGSVTWWHITDDLRFYVWVQFYPIACIPLMLYAFPPSYTHNEFTIYTLLLYILAKVTELLDKQIFRATARLVSGHTLKHLLAAAAIACLQFQISRRSSVLDSK